MHIVVLTKPVPDTTGQERLGPDYRLDRASSPAVVNPNDEYALEAALRLVEAHGGDVTLVTMGPPNAPQTMRKALAMGAHRGVLVTDERLAGSDTLTTARVLAAALQGLDFDLVLGGPDSSDGGTGVVPAGVAALLGLPYLSNAGAIEIEGERVRIRRLGPTGYDLIEAPLPAFAVITQIVVGEPRYPSLKGILAARAREILSRSLDDLGLGDGTVGGGAATTRVVGSRAPAARGPTRVVREPAALAATQVVDFLVQRRLI